MSRWSAEFQTDHRCFWRGTVVVADMLLWLSLNCSSVIFFMHKNVSGFKDETINTGTMSVGRQAAVPQHGSTLTEVHISVDLSVWYKQTGNIRSSCHVGAACVARGSERTVSLTVAVENLFQRSFTFLFDRFFSNFYLLTLQKQRCARDWLGFHLGTLKWDFILKPAGWMYPDLLTGLLLLGI